MRYSTQQDVLDFVEDNNVKFVRFAFCDIFGTQKNIAVLASDLPKALEDGVCFDGSSIAGFMKVEESDLILRPDLPTVTILPWRPTEGRVMQFFCDVEKPDGAPFGGNCRGFLREMNRRYTREKYLEEIRYAKSVMPGLVLTSDVIIGFPGETEAEAMDTVSLVEEVGFDALFTFIYSPRPGTKAAAMPDPATRAEKQKWFDKLLEVQNANSAKLHAAYVGKTVRVLVDGESDDPEYPLTSRTEGNRLVRLKGDKALIGQFADVAVTGSNTWALYGEPV